MTEFKLGDSPVIIKSGPPDYKSVAEITKEGVVTINWDEAEKAAKSKSDMVIWGIATLMLHIRESVAARK
jgi:hypothetical protein